MNRMVFGAAVLTALAMGSTFAQAEEAQSPLVSASTSGGFDWTGFYLGVSVGNANGGSTAIPIDQSFPAKDIEGGVVQVQGGYNWQQGNLVYGVEVAASSTDIETPDTVSSCVLGIGCEYVNVDQTASISGRIGMAMDRTLVYGSLGYARAKATAIDWDASPTSASHTHHGVMAAIGIEHAFTDRLSGLLEYNYTKYSAETYLLGDPDDVDFDLGTIRVGMNFRF